MAKKSSLTASYDALPFLLRIIIQLVLGALVGGIYRIVRYVESKNIVTLVVGLVGLFTGVGNFVLEVADVVTEILSNKITFFAD